eukprot:CAMPEP_0171453134 /NCGR_PEP_ID=MMETSP0945-20130129/964_1 /TAXON_ID=109269 /ORGANISM="Vaucheria litorea, Strain CCMP2940" /LENGTH=196 /DNA_ID=CAMNT_0011977941 /DNA_START=97 /DNA_END=687 /DNA_ORIENTATION=-
MNSHDMMSRRRIISYTAFTACVGSIANKNAYAFFESNQVENDLRDLSKYVIRVDKLVDDLKQKNLMGDKEDSDVVFRILKTYLEPMQEKMYQIAPNLKLPDSANQERAITLSLVMKGHLFELREAIKNLKPSEQLAEAEEVQETLDEFLQLAGLKYKVPVPKAPQSATPAEYYGLFGCEAWGQKRAEGSNSCIPIK